MSALERLAEHLTDRPAEPLPDGLRRAVLDDLAQPLARVRRDAAIRQAAALLDPNDSVAPSRLAKSLSDKLAAFHERAWPRIRQGYRPPNSELEEIMVEIVTSGESCGHLKSWRAIYECLQDGLQKERAMLRINAD